MTQYDVVYAWTGSAENGEWSEAALNAHPSRQEVDEMVDLLQKAGYRAVRGLRRIGPPEGPPSR